MCLELPVPAWDAAPRLSSPPVGPRSERRPTPEPPAMASLLAKDAYLQNLAKKICSQPSPEPQKRKSGKAQPPAGTGRASEGGAPPPRSVPTPLRGGGRCLPHTAPE